MQAPMKPSQRAVIKSIRVLAVNSRPLRSFVHVCLAYYNGVTLNAASSRVLSTILI